MTAWLDLTGIAFAVDWVDAAGIRTRRLYAGSGPDVVFLHGTSGHLEAFTRNFVAHVDAGYRCHAIDMLGHGYTGKPDFDYEITDYVRHLTSVLDALALDRVNLAGESLGGWVAAAFAADNPERVTSLQLIAAGGTKANPEVMERIRSSTLRAVTTDDIELTRQRLNLLMHDPAANVSDELVESVTFPSAMEHFDTILQASLGESKIVVASRPEHFLAEREAVRELRSRVESLLGSRFLVLQPPQEPVGGRRRKHR